MSAIIPPNTVTKRGVQKGRWRWYYAAIADYRILHPGCKNEEIAQHLRRHPNTVYAITNSDIYKEYEAQRMQAFRDQSDATLRIRLVSVATKALESVEVQLDKKKDQVPLQLASEVAMGALDRLGFAPKPNPTVVVNNQQVVIPNAVSPAALEEARAALRAVEQRRLSGASEIDAIAAPVEVDVGLPLAEEVEAPSGDS